MVVPGAWPTLLYSLGANAEVGAEIELVPAPTVAGAGVYRRIVVQPTMSSTLTREVVRMKENRLRRTPSKKLPLGCACASDVPCEPTIASVRDDVADSLLLSQQRTPASYKCRNIMWHVDLRSVVLCVGGCLLLDASVAPTAAVDV